MTDAQTDLRTALRSTGAARRFTDEPVSDELLSELLNDARFAPSGGNRQPWLVAVVREVALRRQLGDLMQPVWDEYVAVSATGRSPFNAVDGLPGLDDELRAAIGEPPHTTNELIDIIESVPVVLAIAADLRLIAMMDGELPRVTLTGGASVYPFCWSLLLAARHRGLGGVITTFLSRAEPEAGPLLGLPPHHVLAATVFLGHPEHQPTKLSRKPVDSFTTIDRFDGEPFAVDQA